MMICAIRLRSKPSCCRSADTLHRALIMQAFQAEVLALHKLLTAHGIHHFADVLYSLRLKVASSPSAGASPKYL